MNRKQRLGSRRGEKLLDPTQIAEAFFPDRSGEGDRTGRLYAPSHQGTSDRKEDGESPAIVADARTAEYRSVATHLDVRPFRKHGVEVRRDDDMRSSSRPGPSAQDIAHAIHPHVAEAC